jgi:hypothetical protein
MKRVLRKKWIVLLLVLGGLLGAVLLSAFMRVRAHHRFYLQAGRLQDAVRHEAGLREVDVDTDSTAPYGLVISCNRLLPPGDKARLEHLFNEYFPGVPTQRVDDMLRISYELQTLDLSPAPSLPHKGAP